MDRRRRVDPDGDRCYRLTYVTQPTIRGTQLRLAVEPPAGYRPVGEQQDTVDPVTGTTDWTACYAL